MTQRVSLISPEYLLSENCAKELYEAHQAWYQKGKPLFPVKIGRCDLPFILRDMVYDDLSDTVTPEGHVIPSILENKVAHLATNIRRRLEPRIDLLRFFDPTNSQPVRLVTNRSYITPFSTKTFSTTIRFADSVAELLRLLNRRGVISAWSSVNSDYLVERDWQALVDGAENLVSYASSKINPVTDLILRRLESTYDTNLRFVFEDDLAAARAESTFPDASPSRRVSLIVKDKVLAYLKDRDHGLVLRARATPGAGKHWWIVAGCGRPGSVAAYRLLFDSAWAAVLWPRITSRLPDAFYAIVTVKYDPVASDDPIQPEIVDFQVMR